MPASHPGLSANADELYQLLLAAIKAGREAEVEDFVTREWAKGDHRNITLFEASVKGGQPGIVRCLLQHGVVPYWESPIFLAIRQVSALKVVLAEGYNLDVTSSAQKRPLHVAASVNPPALPALLCAGADVTARDGVHGNTALHVACTSCQEESILRLIQAGAWLNEINVNGETPLHCLLKHASTGPRRHDFHARSRQALARCLIHVGMVIAVTSIPRDGLKEEGRRRKCATMAQGYRKVVQTFQRLVRETRIASGGVWCLQHLCRLRVRQLCEKGETGGGGGGGGGEADGGRDAGGGVGEALSPGGRGRGGGGGVRSVVEVVEEGLEVSCYLRDYLLYKGHVLDRTVFTPCRDKASSVLDTSFSS